MNPALKGWKLVMFVIAALLTSMATISENCLAPVWASVYSLFGYGIEGNTIVSSTNLAWALTALATAVLMRHISKKKLLVCGTIAFTVGILCCPLVLNAGYMIFMRILMGIGAGIVMPVIYAYIAQIFVDDKMRARFYGFWNAAMTLIGAIMVYIVGVLAVDDWTRAFFVFIPMVITCIMVIFFISDLGVPAKEPQKKLDKMEVAESKQIGGSSWGLFWAFMVTLCMLTIIFMLFLYFSGTAVEEKGVGDAAFAGALVSMMNLASFLVSLCFGFIYDKLKKRCIYVATACIACTMVCFGLGESAAILVIGAVVGGIGYGLLNTFAPTYIADIMPADKVDSAIGIFNCLFMVAIFINPYIATGLAGGFFEYAFTPLYLIYAIACLVPLVIEIATIRPYRKLMAEKMQLETELEEQDS